MFQEELDNVLFYKRRLFSVAKYISLRFISFLLIGISEENLAKLCEHAQIPPDYRFVKPIPSF